MNHLTGNWVITLLLSVILVGCNDDIFVDDITLSETEFTIDGNGGSHTIRFEPKGLKKIGVNLISSATSPLTYYNRAGEVVLADSPASDVARINYHSPVLNFDIIIDGKHLTINGIESNSTYDFDIPVTLDYGYSSQFFTITVTGTKGFELVSIKYDVDNMTIVETDKIDRTSIRYINEGSLAIEAELLPYINQTASILIDQTELPWLKSQDITADIPSFKNGEWGLYGNKLQLRLNDAISHSPAGVDRHLKVAYTIAPLSSVVVTTEVYHTKLTLPFNMVLKNISSGKEFTTHGICTATEPYNYKIVTSDAK